MRSENSIIREKTRTELLNNLFAQKERLQSAQLGRCLSTKHNRSVYLGRLNGRKVIFKLRSGGAFKEQIKSYRANLKQTRRYMNTGPYRINRLIAALPEYGLLITDFVPGDIFGKAVQEAGPEQRRHLLQQAGDWLLHFTAPQRQTGRRFNAKAWLKLQMLNVTNPPVGSTKLTEPSDLALADALLKALEEQAEHLDGATCTTAALHGDFQIGNLIQNGDVLVGIDLEGENYGPVAQDISHFLVGLQNNCTLQTESYRYGFVKDDIDAILRPGLIQEHEVETVFPFVLGAELHTSFILRSHRGNVLEQGRKTIQRYLDSM